METLTKKIFDVEALRKDFPILQTENKGRKLIYLDNAATTQKPLSVINAITDYYKTYNSNIHRGVYSISIKATGAYDNARERIRKFINAREAREIIFTKGTTESINLVSFSFGSANINEGDEILVSALEHHADIVPWQVLCERKKAFLKIIPVNSRGEINIEEYKKLLGKRTKLAAFCHISNAIGTVNPVKEMIALAHEKNIHVLIDGAQAVQHLQVDVQALDADFYAFSGHKMYGPMGIGVLYGKAGLLENMPPYQTGGDMISSVSFAKTMYNEIPAKFEAGTPNVEGAVGLHAAADYLSSVGIEAVKEYENELLQYATEKISGIDGVRITGTAEKKASSLSFTVNGINAFDIGVLLDTYGVAVRTGQHCAEPLMDIFGIPGTVRASFAFYNTKEEIDVFINALNSAIKILK